MATKLWECQPRTKAKLEIVSHYLAAWFNILAAKEFPHVIYIDGFCGPGKYSTGEEGSPVIAARIANSTAQKYPGFKATLIFIDENQKALEHLASIDAIKKQHPNVTIQIKQGKFSDEIDNILAYLKANPNSPTFSFVDPFGFGQSPFEKLKLLMHNDHSELFINFMCGFMNRFKEHENEDVTQKIKDMVGRDDLVPFIKSSDPIDELCQAFDANLKSLGKHTLKFAMRDEGNIRDNAFFFCGRQSRGFEKIKEAMWRIDPEQGNAFSAHAELKSKASGQVSLFDKQPHTIGLSSLLMKKFSGQSNVSVETIFKWVIEETDNFLPTHARTELERLLEQGSIAYRDPQDTGRKKRKNAWPERLLISFK